MNCNSRCLMLLPVLLLLGAIALSSAAHADLIFIGNANGEVIGRDEFDLNTHYELAYLSNGGSQFPITKMIAVGNDLIYGIGAGGTYNVQLRHANDLSTWVTDVATGFPISALGYRSFDDCILIGDTGPDVSGGNGTFVRTRADLTLRPPTYFGGYGLTDGGNWGMGITAMDCFPDNGDFLVGTAGNGTVTTRKANCIWDYTVSRDASLVVFGEPIVGAGVIDNTKFVLGTQGGMLSVRPRADVTLETPAGNHVSFGKTMTAFLMLPGGKVAMGFADGEVAIRDTADVAAVIPNGSAYFTGKINALALTSNGNLAIATENNLLYLHKVSNLLQPADGVATAMINLLSPGYPENPNPPILCAVAINVPPPPQPTIAAAKSAAENSPVMLTAELVTAKFYEGYDQVCFAVGALDRTSGIRIISSVPVEVGDIVDVNGVAFTDSGERVVDARGGSVDILSNGYPVPEPLGLNNTASAGGEISAQGAVVNKAPSEMSMGANTVGLRMTIWGKVMARNSTGDYDGYFYIDDGSAIDDGSGNIGIKCRPSGVNPTPDALPAVGNYVTVTGVMGVRQVGGVNARYFWTESWQ